MQTMESIPWYRVSTVWLIFGIPTVAVVVGFVMLGFAIVSYDGLVVDDYYRRGKEINLDLARDRLALEQGRSASLIVAQHELRVDLRSRVASSPTRIDAQLLHATRQGHDRNLLLERDTDGVYRAALADLSPGRYDVQLSAEGWRLLGSLAVPGDTRIELGAKAN